VSYHNSYSIIYDELVKS